MRDYPFFPRCGKKPSFFHLNNYLTGIKNLLYYLHIKEGAGNKFFLKKKFIENGCIMDKLDEAERRVLLQDLKRLDAKKQSLTKQLKETNQEIDKLEKKLKDMSRK